MSREVPEGWASVKIGEVLSIRRGVTWDKDTEIALGSDDAMPVISIPNIQDRLRLDHLRYINKTLISNVDKFVARSGWTLMVGSNGNPERVGNCVLATGVDECLFASFLLGIYPLDSLNVLPEYCYRILSNKTVQDAISASVQGTTGLRNISVKMLRELEVPLPPLHEQRRIAEILSSVDEAIAATRAVIEQTRKVKQGVLERLLTKGIGHTRFKQTEIGEIPEGWEVLELQDVASVRTGIAKNKKEIIDAVDLPYLRVANVQDGYVDLSDLQNISIPRGQVERYSLQKGDLLMTEGGDYDKLGRGDVWDGSVEPCLHQNHVFAVRPDQSRIVPEFLANLTASLGGKAYFQSCSKRSTNLASINSTQVKHFPVKLPELGEQLEIVGVSKAFDAAISVATTRLDREIHFKSALMSDLLTGRKRVTDALLMAAE